MRSLKKYVLATTLSLSLSITSFAFTGEEEAGGGSGGGGGGAPQVVKTIEDLSTDLLKLTRSYCDTEASLAFSLTSSSFLKAGRGHVRVDLSEDKREGKDMEALSRLLLEADSVTFLNIKRDDFRALASSLSAVKKLTIACSRETRIAELVVASAHLSNLTTLALCGNDIGDAAVTAIAGRPYMRSLMTLKLNGCHIGDAGAIVLAQSPHMRSLTTLDLSRASNIGDATAIAIAQSPHMRSLTTLKLNGHHIGMRGP